MFTVYDKNSEVFLKLKYSFWTRSVQNDMNIVILLHCSS
jgi:hypothetical protein